MTGKLEDVAFDLFKTSSNTMYSNEKGTDGKKCQRDRKYPNEGRFRVEWITWD